MEEIYKCVCGGEQFYIHDYTITCPSCGRIYSLKFEEGNGLESPKDFNSRIRSEEEKRE